MYDIEILLPVNFNGRYKQRFLDFKKHGLINIGEKRVKLIVLGDETTDLKDLKSDWDGVTVCAYICPHKHPALKSCYYYLNLISDDCRWYMRVDDDSFTDVSYTLKCLDEYDWTREYFFVSEMCAGDMEIEINILKDMGYRHWFSTPQKHLWHDVECGVFSLAAVNKIKNNIAAKDFLERRIMIERGFSDIPPAAIARLAGVYPIDAYFITSYPYAAQFVLLGGYLGHIHKIARDVNSDSFHKVIDKLEGKLEFNHDPDAAKHYFFTNNNTKFGCSIKLEENGFIYPSQKDAYRWQVVDGRLYFYDLLYRHTYTFDKLSSIGHEYKLFSKKVKSKTNWIGKLHRSSEEYELIINDSDTAKCS